MELISVRGSCSRYLSWAPKYLDSSLLAWIFFSSIPCQQIPSSLKTFLSQIALRHCRRGQDVSPCRWYLSTKL